MRECSRMTYSEGRITDKRAGSALTNASINREVKIDETDKTAGSMLMDASSSGDKSVMEGRDNGKHVIPSWAEGAQMVLLREILGRGQDVWARQLERGCIREGRMAGIDHREGMKGRTCGIDN